MNNSKKDITFEYICTLSQDNPLVIQWNKRVRNLSYWQINA